MLLWAVLGVLPIVTAAGDVRLAAGAAGTAGTLTVDRCVELGRGRYDCDGTFVPDGGGAPVAVDASPDSTAGDVRRAQLAPAGDRAVPAGPAGVLAALTLPFLGVAVLALLPAVLLHVVGARARLRALVAGGAVAAVALLGVVAGIVAAYL